MTRLPSQDLEISPAEAARLLEKGERLIDIRSAGLRASGWPEGSEHAAEDRLADLLDTRNPGGTGQVLLLCARGVSSLRLADDLHAAGHRNVKSVAGGFEAWRQADLPCRWPAGFDAESSERYARHLAMPQVGATGQARLLESRVLLVGMGGLGSPAGLYLAAAGVGTLGLLDHDRVERSNLQRQVLHTESAVGSSKVDSAAASLAALNPRLAIRKLEHRVGDDNAADLVRGWDVVIDGTDNFEARYALNRACLSAGVPLVYGAVMRFQGQVSVFWPKGAARGDGPCLRCFMPRAPGPDEAPACADAGVLGVLPGLVGTLQATEALKLLLGTGRSLAGRLLMLDALGMEFREAAISRVADCPDCG
jgi:molybdopterin/thiamine biosynthesis adenylyltransferase/rhodanese-related sulfurtransferase